MRPINYAMPNAADRQPNMTSDGIAAYRAILADQPIPRGHYLVESLMEAADRLRCDACARSLTERGIDAVVATFEGHEIYTTMICFDIGKRTYAVNHVFASRMLARLNSGLTPEEAAERTCDPAQPKLSVAALRDMERDADAHGRRLDLAHN